MPKILESEALTIARSIDQAPETDRPWMLDLLDRYQQQQRDEGEPDWPSVERARVERETNLRGMFESPEKITYDPGPFSQNPQEAKMLHANMALLSARYQKEPAEVASRYDFLLNDYARQKLGASEDVDTAKFYALAQKAMQRIKLREDTQREGMSAALRGEDGVKALAAWQAKNADRAKDDAGLFMRGYQQALEQDGEMLPIADRLLPLLEAQSAKKDGQAFDQTKAQELGNMIEQLAGMKKAQRKSVYRSIAARIEAAGYDQKGFWSQMLGELDKALYRMEGTVGTSAGIASDVATAVAGAQTRIPDTFDGSSVSMPVLSDEEQQALLRQQDYRERIGNVQEEILQIVSGELDPVRPTLGWLNDTIETGAIKGPGAVAPFMAASALLGPYGAGLVFTADFAEQNRRELVQIGLDADQARKVGAMAAPLQAAVESLSNMVSLGKFPAVQAALSRFTRPVGGASLVGRYVQNSLISVAIEFTEEQVQANLIVPVIQEVLGVFETYMPEVDWSFYKTRAANSTPELAATLLPMALVFGGVMTAADAKLSRTTTQNVDLMMSTGMDQAQAVEVASQPTQEQRIRKGAELWSQRKGTKASMEEAQKKLADQYRTLAADSAAAVKELEARGVLPRLLPMQGGEYRLTFNDGSTADFKTREEALGGIHVYIRDRMQRSTRALRETIDTLTKNLEQGREFALEISPEAMPADEAVKRGIISPQALQERAEQGAILDATTLIENSVLTGKALGDEEAPLMLFGMSKNEWYDKEGRAIGMQRIKDDILRTTMRLWDGASPLTLIEEKTEGDAKVILSTPGKRQWMLDHLRAYEDASGDKLFTSDDNEQINDKQLIEAWSHVAQSYFVAAKDKVKGRTLGRYLRDIEEAELTAAMQGRASWWQAVVNRAQKLGELKAAGKLNEDVVAELEKQLGIDSQVKHEQGAMQEVRQVRDEVAQQVDTSGYSEETPGPNGETFSISSKELRVKIEVSPDSTTLGNLGITEGFHANHGGEVVPDFAPRASKQGRKGQYAGFYLGPAIDEVSQYGQNVSTFPLNPNTPVKVLRRPGQVERITPEMAAAWRAEGFSVVVGPAIISSRIEIATLSPSVLSGETFSMASDSGAAQANEPSPGGLSEAEVLEAEPWMETRNERQDFIQSLRLRGMSMVDIHERARNAIKWIESKIDKLGGYTWTSRSDPRAKLNESRGVWQLVESDTKADYWRELIPDYDSLKVTLREAVFANKIGSDIRPYIIYRGESKMPAVKSISVEHGAVSNISNSEYPFVRVNLQNGAEALVQIRVSDHEQVSDRSPRHYAIDLRMSRRKGERATSYDRRILDAAHDQIIAAVNDIWKEQKDIKANAGPIAESGAAGIKAKPLKSTGVPDSDLSRIDARQSSEVNPESSRAAGGTFSASRAIPADSSKQTLMPDGARLVGPTTFSIRAYHGTPHKVDKFRTEKIGTGEGAQAYGWGLYFAEEKAVAEQYKNALAYKSQKKLYDGGAFNADNPAHVLAFLGEWGSREMASTGEADGYDTEGISREQAQAAVKWLEDGKPLADYRITPKSSNLYTVELLPDADEFLDWDRPLSEQSEKVKVALAKFIDSLPFNEREDFTYQDKRNVDKYSNGQITGAALYNRFHAPSASKKLASLGIPGIRYLDGGSRNAGDGTRNYVIFDENLVRILEENGKPVVQETFSLRPGDFASRVEAMFSPFQRSPEARLVMARVAKDRALRVMPQLLELQAEFNDINRQRQDLETKFAEESAQLRADLEADEQQVRQERDFELKGVSQDKGSELDRERIRRDADNKLSRLRLEYERSIRELEKRKETETAKLARKDNSAQREKTRQLLKLHDAILAAVPAKIRPSIGGFASVVKFTSNEQALEFLQKRMTRIDSVVEKYLITEARGQLERIFDKARPKSDAGEKAKGKLTPELHAWFKLAEEAAKLSPAVADERIQGIEQSLASDMTDAIKQELSDWLGRPVTDDAEAQTWQETRLTLFQTFGAVMYGTDAKSERNAAEITAALDAAREAYQTGRLAHIEQLAKLREKRAEERGDGIQRVGSPYDPNKANTRKKALNKATGLKGRALDYMDTGLDASGFFLDLLGDDTTTDLYETTRRNLLEAEATKADNMEKRKADFAAMLKQVFPGKGLVDRLRGLWELQQIQENAPVGTMSQLQAMQFTLWHLDPDSREWLATNGYGDEWQAKAEQWLTSEAKAVRAWLLKQYDGQYDRLNPVFRRLRGVNLPRVEVYGGKRQIEHSKSDSTASIEADMMRGGMDAGFTKTRVSRPTGRPRMTDALQNYWQNALQVEHYIAFAETVTELKAVFGHRDFLGAVETNRGLATKQQVLDWISNIETAGTRDAFAHSMQGKLFGRYGKAVSASALLFKLATLAKQAPAAIQSAFKVGLKEYFTSLSRILAGKGAISLGDMYRSDTVQRRLSGHDNEMLQASKGWNQRHFDNEILDKAAIASEVMMNAGWYAIGWTDARYTTISAAVAYDVAFRDGKKLGIGMTDDEAKAFAANQADLIVMETAQPQGVVTKSLSENMMPQALLRLVFAFQSANRQIFGLTYLAAKQGKVANAYAVAAIIAAMTQTIGGIMRMLFSDDDPEELFDPQAYALGMATAPLTGMVGFGPLVEFGLNFAGVESRFSPSSAAAAKSLQDIVNGEADTKDVGRVVSMAGAALGGRGAMLSVGWNVLNQIMGLYENAADQ